MSFPVSKKTDNTTWDKQMRICDWCGKIIHARLRYGSKNCGLSQSWNMHFPTGTGTLAIVRSFLQSPFRLHDVYATLWLYLQEEGDRIVAHFPEVLKRERWYLSSVQNVDCNISTHCRHFHILTIHWLGHLRWWNLLLCVRIYSTMLGGLTTAHLESLYPKEASQRNSDSWVRLSKKVVPRAANSGNDECFVSDEMIHPLVKPCNERAF